jgi:ribosomal protein L37AE/L43A
MFSASKVRCPKCERQVPKRIMLINHGRCNNCGYKIAGALTTFAPLPKSSLDLGPSGVSV